MGAEGAGIREDPGEGASLTHAAEVQAAVKSFYSAAYRHTQLMQTTVPPRQ